MRATSICSGQTILPCLSSLRAQPLSEASSTNRLNGLRRREDGCSGIVGTDIVIYGQQKDERPGGLVERPEPRKTSLDTTKCVCSSNNGVIEMGSRPGRCKVGICKRRIEVEDNLVGREKIKGCS